MVRSVVLLDNRDSFTYNLVDEFLKMDYDVQVYRNTLSAEFIRSRLSALEGTAILVLSPGPGAPSQAGCMPDLIKQTVGKNPILGICLGHQALIEHYGGQIRRAKTVMHGKSSLIRHEGRRMFENLPNPLAVGRYHSLVVGSVKGGLEVTATHDDMVMAVWHDRDIVMGMQFHPESLLTTFGSQLLHQSIRYLEKRFYAKPVG